MFWTGDAYSTRRSQSSNNSNLKFMSNPTESGQSSLHSQAQKPDPKDSISQKVQKFISVNKRHQLDEVCACEDCIYAKQLNRYQALKMDLSKSSSYRMQYNKNSLKKNFSVAEDLKQSTVSSKPEEGNMSKNSPYVDINSVYKNEYASRSVGKVEKPRPQDELKFTGPSSSFSSYKQMYPSINGPYQYVFLVLQKVQPAKSYALPSLKFNAESLYSNSFKGVGQVETESAKMNDQLKLGKSFIVRESTQKSQYANPQNSSFFMSDRYNTSRERRIETPNFSFQYSNFFVKKETINQDELYKPASKKNCRNKRLQVLHGQMAASQNLSTIM